MAAETLGEKDVTWLSRYVQGAIATTPAQLPPSLEGEVLSATDKLVVGNDIELSPRAVEKLKTYLGL